MHGLAREPAHEVCAYWFPLTIILQAPCWPLPYVFDWWGQVCSCVNTASTVGSPSFEPGITARLPAELHPSVGVATSYMEDCVGIVWMATIFALVMVIGWDSALLAILDLTWLTYGIGALSALAIMLSHEGLHLLGATYIAWWTMI